MGVVIRRWVWLETIGVVSGCFPHITYISLLLLYLLFFAAVYIYISHMFCSRMAAINNLICNEQNGVSSQCANVTSSLRVKGHVRE